MSLTTHLNEIVEVMILNDKVLAALPQHLTIGFGALRFPSGSAVLEPNLHLPGLHSQLHRQCALLMGIGPWQPLKGVFQEPQLCLGESQLPA